MKFSISIKNTDSRTNGIKWDSLRGCFFSSGVLNCRRSWKQESYPATISCNTDQLNGEQSEDGKRLLLFLFASLV